METPKPAPAAAGLVADTGHLSRFPPAHPPIAPSIHAPDLLTEHGRQGFLGELRQQVQAAAEQELAGSGWTAEHCPYIEHWLGYYDRRGAGDIEAALRRYVPGAMAATTASEYLPLVTERVRLAMRRWRATAEIDAPTLPALDTPAAVEARFPDAVPLPSSVRTQMEGAFERNLGDVRVHTSGQGMMRAGETSARALAVGQTIVFGDRQFDPTSTTGQLLLAHELAHTQQQSPARATMSSFAPGAAHEVEANRAAAGAVGWMHAGVRGAWKATRTSLGLQRCRHKEGPKDAAQDAGVVAQDAGVKPDSPFVAGIKKSIGESNSADVFKQIRDATGASKDDQTAIDTAIEAATIPSLSDDDKWLAEHMVADLTTGSSTAPQDDMRMFSDPDPGTATPIQTEVHLIAGRSNRRALVIGGVHGSEPEGEVVVRQLLTALAASPTKPYFTLVVVPRLIAKGREVTGSKSGADDFREVRDATAKGTANSTSVGTGSKGNIEVEPNRNLPKPGTSYDTYKKVGHLEFWDRDTNTVRPPKDIVTTTKGKENRAKAVASEHMLPENRMLVHLIERFQPERLVTVHQHHVPGGRGNGPGVFVDPRRPATKLSADDAVDANDQALTAEGQQDDKLAIAMRDAVQRDAEAQGIRKKGLDPLAGNSVLLPRARAKRGGKLPTVHYATEAHAEGNSLGDYAPVEVKEGGAGDRPAIATFTVELPQYDKKDRSQADALAKLETIDVDTLMKVFLEDPSKIP